MRLFYRAASIAFVVFRVIWLIAAVVLWIGGLVYFIERTEFLSWLAWGMACAIPLCVQIIKNTVDSARRGAHEGSHEYTITYSPDTGNVDVRDHSASGCLWGLLGGLFGGILVGPVVLPLYFVGVLGTTIADIRLLVSSR